MNKLIYIILNKVKSIIKNNPLVFTITIVGMTACYIMFLYSYGVLSLMWAGTDDDYTITRVSDDAENSVAVIQAEIEKNNPKGTVNYYAIADCSDRVPNDEDYAVIRAVSDSDFYFITGKVSDLLNPYTVAVPIINGYEYGDTIELNGIELTVIGTQLTDFFIMSTDTFSLCGFDILEITLPLRDNGKAVDNLSDALPGYNVEYSVNPDNVREAMVNGLKIYAVYILCLLSFISLCTYIYDDSAYELVVYEMFGSSRKKSIMIISGTLFVIMSAASLVSQLIFMIFYKSVFSSLFSSFGLGTYNYTAGDYLFIYLITIILLLLFVVLYTWRRMRKSMISNSRKLMK